MFLLNSYTKVTVVEQYISYSPNTSTKKNPIHSIQQKNIADKLAADLQEDSTQ